MTIAALSEDDTLGLQPTQNYWALLVGIDRYVDPQIGPLKYCGKDVIALEELLRQGHYQVTCMHDGLDNESHLFPTRENIEAQLHLLKDCASENDLILVHFSCHGIRLHDQPYLITKDTRLNNLRHDPDKGLTLKWVEERMRESEARRRVLFLDACHVGVEMGRGEFADPEFLRNAYELAEGFALLAGSTAQQKSWENKEHGIFTYHLLTGLRGDADRQGKGFVTVNDLATHVVNGVKRWTFGTGIVQEPTARTEGIGDMKLIEPAGITIKISEGDQMETSRNTTRSRTSVGIADEPETAHKSSRQSPQISLRDQLEIERLTLELSDREADYRGISNQLREEQDVRAQGILNRQLESIGKKIDAIQQRLHELGGV